MNIPSLNIILAQATSGAPAASGAAPAGQGAPPPGGLLGSPLILFGLMFVIMYFVMIRPQQKRAKEQRKMLESLKSGDRVVTASGIVGEVITVKDGTVSIRSMDAKMEVTKSSIVELIKN